MSRRRTVKKENGFALRLRALVLTLLLATATLHLARAQERTFIPVTDEMLQGIDAADWLRWRRDHSASGYSPLEQVTPQNVQKLRLSWSWAMEAGTQEQEPIVHAGVMYLPHTNGVVQALDARTGALIWEYRRKLPPGMGSGTTRNIAIYGVNVFLSTEDGYLVALDAETGKVAWETKVGDPQKRMDYSTGPIAAEGRIFSGLTCGTGTSLVCFVSAHEAATGKLLWKRESIAGPGDPEAHQATWGGVPYDGRRKGSFWMTGSYDPISKTLYWSSASASPYPEILKGTGKGALLYTNSILGLSSETGAIKWFFQLQPRDNFDMDHQDNPILADVNNAGALRKLVFVLGKPGILWAFDREKGSYVWHKQLTTFQNLYKSIDPATGAIAMNEDIIPTKVGDSQLVCPGMRGGKLLQAKAYSPRTNMLYSPVSNACTVNKVVSSDSGLDYDQIEHMDGSAGKVGRLAAVSAATGELRWTYDQRAAMGSVLTTGGDLVFAGDFYRYFRAFDAETGKVLWEIPLSGPVTGYPISYAVEGKQYVAVTVGGGTPGQRHLARLYPELKASTGSNVLMVFALAD